MPRSKRPARGICAAAGLGSVPFVRRLLLRRTGHSRRRAMRVVVMPVMMQTNVHRPLGYGACALKSIRGMAR